MTQRNSARPAGRRFAVLLGTTALTLGLAAGAAQAQDEETAVEAVVVTGSRAALQGFQAPTPTAVIGATAIEQQAVTNVSTILNQNPAFKGTRSPSGNAQNQASPAQATADLRGLGGQRTLVLVNGKRTVPFAPSSNLSVPTAVDLNLLPTIMIDRVEVVTGGASAQYGSDAVGGVVNLIFKNRYNGLNLRAQYGVSQYGDYRGGRIAAIAGTDFSGGRGHVTIAGDFYDNNGVGDSSQRKWANRLSNVFQNPSPATNGLPAFLNITNVRNANSVGGLITSGPLKGQTFTSATTFRPYDGGILNNGTTQLGGEGEAPNRGQQLVPAVRTASAYMHAEYQLTDSITAYIEPSYGYSLGELNARPVSEGGYGGSARIAGTIQGSNPFLPAAVAAAYNGVGGNPSSFSFVKQDFAIGGLQSYVQNYTKRVLAGLDGDLGKFVVGDNWKWDAHVGWGENHYHADYRNTVIQGNSAPAVPGGPLVTSRVTQALDAVLVTAANVGTSGLPVGSIQCRSTLTAPTNGCVPYNPFGPNSGSQAARDFVSYDSLNEVFYKQYNAAFNLRGEPFALWAGPVAFATGIEWRKESERLESDFYAANNALQTGNAPPWSGKYDVTEGYAEAAVPLAKDMAWAKSLNFDGAGRLAHYSNVGDQWTWKVGLNYEPVTGIRFRVTKSQDIRAPALWELYAPGNAQSNNISVRNRNTGVLETRFIPQNSSGGSPTVQPENAKTTTIGVVLNPIRGLDISVDRYNINIKDAITNFAGANVANLCNQGQQRFCDYFSFDANGSVTALYNPAINLGGLQNIGYDFVVSYRKDLAEISEKLSGVLTTNLSGTYTQHVYVNSGLPGTPIIDRAGDNGQAAQSTGGAIPWLRANLAVNYANGPLSLTTTLLYVSKGRLDNTYNTGNPANTIDNNVVKEYWNTGLFGSYNITRQLQIFGGVQNLFNVEPSNSPYSVLNTAVSGAYYDKIGRTFQLGLDFKF
jgi:outer membrane receptor protein involved in Fe transport